MDTSTMQRMVDKSRQVFVVEGKPKGLSKSGGNCVYFHDDGTPACVIGLFLPPGMHGLLKEKSLNGSSLNELLNYSGMQEILRKDSATTIDELFDERGIEFLQALQSAHDRCTGTGASFTREFDGNLRTMCGSFKLDYPDQYTPPQGSSGGASVLNV